MMNSKKTIFKILGTFISVSVCVSILILIINFLSFAFFLSDEANIYDTSPVKKLDIISDNLKNNYLDESITLTDEWAILVNDDGDVVWQMNKPDEIPLHYSINDIARLTKWYLKDYPVYVRTRDDGLLIMGMPKDSYAKYSVHFSNKWFHNLELKAAAVLLVNVLLAVVLSVFISLNLYRSIKSFVNGIQALRLEKPVYIRPKGIFKYLSASINDTSMSIEAKNKALQEKDNARKDWIKGVSHDIRTPLSMILGYSSELSHDESLYPDNRKKAEIIVNNSIKIKNLVDDLNLVSSIEHGMPATNFEEINISSLLRNIAVDFLNNMTDNLYTINLDIDAEGIMIKGNENILKRAFSNIIQNSITHNPAGCNISIIQTYNNKNEKCVIEFIDDGIGISDNYSVEKDENSNHGIGLPLSWKIIKYHGGSLKIKNEISGGAKVVITLPALGSHVY